MTELRIPYPKLLLESDGTCDRNFYGVLKEFDHEVTASEIIVRDDNGKVAAEFEALGYYDEDECAKVHDIIQDYYRNRNHYNG